MCKKIVKGLFLLGIAVLYGSHGIHAQYKSDVWVADCGDGTYKNPVLHADYSDPDACRVGDDFYMTSSSFNCLPGLQILHSKDLVTSFEGSGQLVHRELCFEENRAGRLLQPASAWQRGVGAVHPFP